MALLNRRTLLKGAVAVTAAAAAVGQAGPAALACGAPTVHQVDILNFTFSPAVLAVHPGDEVIWTNKDIVPHTATAEDGGWDTGELGPGESGEILVTEATTGAYFCGFHPAMKAEIKKI